MSKKAKANAVLKAQLTTVTADPLLLVALAHSDFLWTVTLLKAKKTDIKDAHSFLKRPMIKDKGILHVFYISRSYYCDLLLYYSTSTVH